MSSLDSDRSKAQTKTLSASVRRLQDALNMHLDESEKSDFVDVLNQFHVSRNIPEFTKCLKSVLDTPAKKQLLALIRKVIPKADVEEFDRCLRFDGRKFDSMPAKRPKKLQRSRPPLTSAESSKTSFLLTGKPKKQLRGKLNKSKEEILSDSSKSTGTYKASDRSRQILKSAMKEKGNEVRHIQLKHSGDAEKGFGFSIRGGSEFGIGVYVSMVDNEGHAEKYGLQPGDLLMEVNDVSFEKISHNEAAKIIRSARQLDMKICRVGRVPGTFVVHQMYKWVNDMGRPVSPPPELEQLGQQDTVGRKSGFALLKDRDERKINVTLKEGQSLGLMIRGGREFGLGIYISGVDPLSMADRAGMKIGDQILDVNGESFLDITHAEAVRVLKISRHLMFTIKDVGKLPYARTKIDQTSWVNRGQHPRIRHQRNNSQNSESSANQSSSNSSIFRKGIGSQLMLNTAISSKWDMIENHAAQLLNDTEQGTLRYYLSEYQSGFITVDGLAMASFELLNTKAKMTMMSEIRNWVRGRDLDKFDILLQRREAQERHGFLSLNQSTYSLDERRGQGHRGHDRSPRRDQSSKYSRSAPASRAATMRERPSRIRRRVAEWEMEPLRQAIEQIEDDPEFIEFQGPSNLRQASRLRSYSTEHLPGPRPNLLKTSLSSRRSMSVETLTPVYIDTTSDLPPSPRSTSTSSTRSRSNSASQRHRSPNSYAHRQRSGSNNSSLRRRHKSVDDLSRSPNQRKKVTPYPSRRGSTTDVKTSLASHSYTHLLNADPNYPESPVHPGSNVVYAEVHQQPRQADGIGSDDSGVDVNGSHGNEKNLNRVTISLDNPVNIDDVLENRSFPGPDSLHSNHSTLTNQSTRSRSSVSTLTNQKSKRDSLSRYSDISGTSSLKPEGSVRSNRNTLQRPPVQILINDGEGSIESMSVDSSPMRLKTSNINNQSKTSSGNRSYQTLSRSHHHHRQRLYESDDDDDYDDGNDDDYDHTGSFEINSDMGDNSDFYVSPLDRVLDEEDSSSDLEHKTKEEARKKYGNIPLRVVNIYKSKPTLGMAIEGGANTRQPVPRVINLQPGGSAYESGGLKVGHVILEVNGRCLIGLEHISAAKTIAEAFKNKMVDSIELLVTDSNAKIKGLA